jgi:cobalt-zinc-cadmium efflux system outer membrane protein
MIAKRTARTAAPIWVTAALLLALAGCQAARPTTRPALDPVAPADAAPATPTLGFVPCSADAAPACAASLDLPALWQLALANNPSLVEAAADVDQARGQQIQARKYPNPRFSFQQDTLGSRIAPYGDTTLLLNQEIITGGKRRLDVAIAGREIDAASLGLLGRRYAVMTSVRRAYYGYLGALYTAELNDSVVALLQKGVETTRKLVETVQNRPRTDLLRLEALLEETRINQARSRFNVQAEWKQVAAAVGLTDLPMPATASRFAEFTPAWDGDEVWARVKAVNARLQQAMVEADTARLAVKRARAEAIPNITLNGGYVNDAMDGTAGGIVGFETPLPLWDLKQGHIRAARARQVKAEAAVRTLETTLSANTAEAFARYRGAQRQVEKLGQEVLPRLQESLDLLLKTYELGGPGVTFNDVLLTEQSLIATRLTLAEARQALWQAIADLEGLMQIDINPHQERYPGRRTV